MNPSSATTAGLIEAPAPPSPVPAPTAAITAPVQGTAGTTVATPVPAGAFTKPATTTQLGTPTAFPAGPSPATGVGGAVTALVVVITLILALAWLAKRMPVLGGGAGNSPALRIVGSLALSPRERVVVVAVGDTQLLMGVGTGGTRVLHTLAEPLATSAPVTPVFAQLLAQHFGKKA